MKQLNIELTKDILNKVRDEANLILFNIKGFGINEMKIVNNIVGLLENAKVNLNFN